MSAPPLISLRGITKTFGEGPTTLRALRGVDLDIEKGDFVAVMGPSGSGKSTMMNILGLLDQPTSGTYAFQGRRVDRLDDNERALLRRYHLGFVFQGYNLLPAPAPWKMSNCRWSIAASPGRNGVRPPAMPWTPWG